MLFLLFPSAICFQIDPIILKRSVKTKSSMSVDVLKSTKYKCSVSSVLNKDTKQHGKAFMFDGEDDTAWSTDQGTPQWIALHFEEPQDITAFRFQFQGGFAGKDSIVSVEDNTGSIHTEPFYPDDINATQLFTLSKRINAAVKIKFTFAASTDFFGRIIVYDLEILK